MSEIYKIGIEIALAGTIMQGLEAISAKMLGINKLAKDTEGGFARWGQAIGGVAAIFAGGALAKGLEHAVSAGGELVKQQTLLRNMGISQGDVLETTAKAQLATHQVIGTDDRRERQGHARTARRHAEPEEKRKPPTRPSCKRPRCSKA